MIVRMLKTREAVLSGVLLLMFTGFALFVDGFLFFDNAAQPGWCVADGDLNLYTLFERSRYWIVPGMIAVPMTFIITTAGIDLSVASIVAMCGIVLGMLYRDAGAPIWAAALGAVLAGLAAGAFNGGVSSYLGIPPLVVTLATMALFRGIGMGLSQAAPISNFPGGFLALSNGNLFSFTIAGNEASFPAPLLALPIAVGLGWLFMRRSWIGRFTECIGENETAARFAAIDVRLHKAALYACCGLVCGVASLFHTALYATAKADTALGMELEVIACVVIGGTRISGGQGSVIGSLLGLLIIGILRVGLEMAGVKSQHIVIVVGLLLIVTAVFNEWMANRRGITS